MKKNTYHVIIHADLQPDATVDLVQLRRLSGIETVYELHRQNALLIFAGGDDAEVCYTLVAKLKKTPGIALVAPRYLFSM